MWTRSSNTINIVSWRVSIFSATSKNLVHLSPKMRFFQTSTIFIALKPLFFCRNLVFEKCPILCPFFGGGGSLIEQKWRTMLFHNFNRTKQPSATTTFLQESGFWWSAKKQFFVKSRKVVSKKSQFFCRFFVANTLDCLSLTLFFGFFFCFFLLFFFLYLLLLFRKSSLCVLVVASCFLHCLVSFLLFLVCFVFLLFLFLARV